MTLLVCTAVATQSGHCPSTDEAGLADVERWMASSDGVQSLPTPLLSKIADLAWAKSDQALTLLQRVAAAGAASTDVYTALATALARHDRWSEAAEAFEKAALLPPPSLQRFTKHRLGNLERISGQSATSLIQDSDFPSSLGLDSDGGWGGHSSHADRTPCDIDIRGANLSMTEFEERYVLQGRPVLLPLESVVVRSRGRQSHPNRCSDAGPWQCTEEGCPEAVLSCEMLASYGLCEKQFGHVWERPPAADLASQRIAALCPLACGTCEPLPPDENRLWTRAEFVRRVGACVVPVVRTSDVAEHQYASSAGGGVHTHHDTLASFVEKEMAAEADASDRERVHAAAKGSTKDPQYVVASRAKARSASSDATDLTQQQQQCWRILDSTMLLHGLGALHGQFLLPADHKRLLFVGAAGSGTPFHDHSNTFSLLPYGRKRWLLLPPSGPYDLPPRHDPVLTSADVSSAVSAGAAAAARGGTGTSAPASRSGQATPTEWLRAYEARPEALPIPPLQCTQPAGTALFVPSGWKHAIINLAPSVGMAVEVGDRDVMARAERAAAQPAVK